MDRRVQIVAIIVIVVIAGTSSFWISEGYNSWMSVIVWGALFGVFVTFLPFRRKSQRRPANMYLAFIVASAFEMFGIPLSVYFVAWFFGVTLPEGFLWGHTLRPYIGNWGMYVGFTLNVIGGLFIYLGWRAVYQRYWSKEEAEGALVTDGIYAYSRHPQYLGFILMTLGLIVHWATIPLLVMWPILVYQYYRLSKIEEQEMEARFGDAYRAYRERVPRFIGFPK